MRIDERRPAHANRRRLMPRTASGPGAEESADCPDSPDCLACIRAAVDVLAGTLWSEVGHRPAAAVEALAADVLERAGGQPPGMDGCHAAAIRRACPEQGVVRPVPTSGSDDLAYGTCLRVARRAVYGRPGFRPP